MDIDGIQLGGMAARGLNVGLLFSSCCLFPLRNGERGPIIVSDRNLIIVTSLAFNYSGNLLAFSLAKVSWIPFCTRVDSLSFHLRLSCALCCFYCQRLATVDAACNLRTRFLSFSSGGWLDSESPLAQSGCGCWVSSCSCTGGWAFPVGICSPRHLTSWFANKLNNSRCLSTTVKTWTLHLEDVARTV